MFSVLFLIFQVICRLDFGFQTQNHLDFVEKTAIILALSLYFVKTKSNDAKRHDNCILKCENF